MYSLELEHLRKEYPNGRGIHGLTLRIEQGEIFGFLGPNGAGKSTAIRTVLGLLRPDSGCGRVMGLDIVSESVAVRRITGYLPSGHSLYTGMSGEENIRFALEVRKYPQGMARARSLADLLGVDLRPTLRGLSHGQRQKVALIVALVHDPQVLILDEPTIGLDPLAQEVFFEMLRAERRRGRTIFFSSHVLSEAEALCDRVGIIRDGNLVEINTIEALRRKKAKRVTLAFRGAPPEIASWPGVDEVQTDRERVSFSYRGGIPALLGLLSRQDVADLTVNDPSLDEVFRTFYRDGRDEGGRPA